MNGSQTLVSRFLLENPSITLRANPLPSKPKVVTVMDIKELTEEMNRFVRSKGWYADDSKRPQTPRNLAISLALEAAEILEHFQWRAEIREKEELAAELADVALYLLQLASLTEIDLEKAILNKIEINKTREWDQK
jgi:NTP pyrophosphatase (non-canonical NTP hydrolase)